MVNLVAVVLILASTTKPQQVPVNDQPHVSQVQNAPAPAVRQLTPKQKAWFAHAIDHILTGE